MRATKRQARHRRREEWQGLIAEQEQSGIAVRAFCQKQGMGEHWFYMWRKRLREQVGPVRFALVETHGWSGQQSSPLELVLISGERLLIRPEGDTTTLRAVLGILREKP